jgi:hypothetical protein
MSELTLDDVRDAKAELIKRLRGRPDFVGAGIGLHDGRLVVRVNWRSLPPEADRPQWVGKIAVTHHEVGAIRAQLDE